MEKQKISYDVWEHQTGTHDISTIEATSAKEAALSWLDLFNIEAVLDMNGGSVKVKPRRCKENALKLSPEERYTKTFIIQAITLITVNDQ